MVGDRHKQIAPGNVPNQGTQPYTLRVTLSDAQGRRVGGQEITIPSHFGTGRETALTLHLDHPLAWNAETPNLYRLNVEMLEGTQVSHSRSLKVGLREISTAGGVFRINGQAVKLRGVNRHDEHPDTGRATTREQWLQDIKGMKAANINYIRAAHYPRRRAFWTSATSWGCMSATRCRWARAAITSRTRALPARRCCAPMRRWRATSTTPPW
jgi:beta-galactosidase